MGATPELPLRSHPERHVALCRHARLEASDERRGQTAGAHKLTGDMTAIAAQVPALFEALSGMKMSELLGKIRLIGDNTGQPNKATTVVPSSPTLPVAQPKA